VLKDNGKIRDGGIDADDIALDGLVRKMLRRIVGDLKRASTEITSAASQKARKEHSRLPIGHEITSHEAAGVGARISTRDE